MSFPSVLRALVNRLSFATILVAALSQTALLGSSNLPSAADGFDPNVNGNVFALATQSDGKILVAGNFTTLQPNGGAVVSRNNIARLNPDGSVDAAFNPNANGQISTMKLQADGRIVLGGAFTTIGGTPRNRLARINSDGTLDSTFDPSANAVVNALALQADGKILVGGAFTTLKSTVARNHIARLNTDGSVDTGFDPNANNIVFAIAVQSDGRIVIGGAFTTLQPNGGASSALARAARLNADGTVDPAFDPEADNTVTCIALELDGRILLGGNFQTLNPNFSTVYGIAHLARFNVDGSMDTNFQPNPDGNITSVTVQSDGNILIGGYFTSISPAGATVATTVSFFTRLGINGTADPTFQPGANFIVTTTVQQADGKILVGGYFTQLISQVLVSIATVRNHLARVNLDGTLDVTFDPNARGGVQAMAIQSDGKVIIGGAFTSIGGTTRNYLARLNTDGSLDLSFNPDLNGRVLAVAVEPDGRIIIGGFFTSVGGASRNYVARLNADGTPDLGAFNPNPSAQVTAIAVQSDGKVLLAGAFSSFQPNGTVATVTRGFLARVLPDGDIDSTYDPEPNSQISSMVVQPDGKLLIAGGFTTLNPNNSTTTAPIARNYVARINTDGSIDAVSPSFNAAVNAIGLQSDGKVIVAGGFSTFQTLTTTSSTYGGSTTSTTTTVRNQLARVNADGSLDTSFDPDLYTVGFQIIITSIAIQPDGKILLAGGYGYIAGYYRNNFARLNADGSLDITYDPNPSAAVQIVKVQADGQALLGGTFVSLQPYGDPAPTQRLHLARITTAGEVDSGFNSAVGGQNGGQVTALAVQSNGKIVVAGSLANLGGDISSNLSRFTNDSTPDVDFNPSADGAINAVASRPIDVAVPTQLDGFAWLNSTGFLQTGFATTAGNVLNGDVTAVARQADGKILLGSANGTLLRYNANGTLDSTFNLPLPDSGISGIIPQSSGQILIYGSFANLGTTVRNHIAMLNSDGSVDQTFDPNANAAVLSVVQQADGKFVLGGAFTTLQPNGSTATVTANFIARINSNGTIDTTYAPNPNGQVSTLALLPDGRIIAGGAFTTVLPTGVAALITRNRLVLLNTNGSADATFDPNANGAVQTIALQPDGKILVGGGFTTFQPNGAPVTTERDYIARLNPDGTLDANFNANATGTVNAISLQADNKILVGGVFAAIGGVTRHGIARLNPDGSLDFSFNPNANGQIEAIGVQADGTIFLGGGFTAIQPNGVLYVGGSFGHLGGAAINNLALLNDDGTPLTGFQPNPNGAVFAVAPQSNGATVVAGAFTTLGGAARNRLARLNADGTLDAAFNPNADNQVNALAVQTDGRILCGGIFTNLGGTARSRLARLNADGTLDTFNPGADGQVNVIAVQADGRVIIGGAFANAGGAARKGLARLNVDGSVDASFNPAPDGVVNAIVIQADGRIIVAGAFANIAGTARSRLARLNADGSIDATFDPGADNTVNALSLAADGKLLVGGSFSQISGLARYRLARIATTTVASQFITVNSSLTTLTWNRGGSAPELSAVAFEQSPDGTVWTPIGQATRVGASANWQLSGLNLPGAAFLYARARGLAPTSQYGSSGVVESIRLLGPVATVTASSVTTVLSNSPTGGGTTTTGFSASGLPAGLSIDPTTGIISGTPTQSGSFAITISDTTASGTNSTSLTLSVAAGSPVSSRLAALSARTRVSAANPLITGFVISGTESKSVLLRAVGPGLGALGVSGVLSDPELRLYNSSVQLILTADSWEGQGSLASVFSIVGAFSLASNSADAACVVTLPPGVYTVQVADPANAGGVALAEIYEIGATTAGATRLIEMSARGASGTGDSVLIGGLVIDGSSPKKVLIRGVGPGLTPLGVTNALGDPMLSVFNSQAQIIAQNDNWETPVTVNTTYPGASASAISTAASSAGGFALSSGSKDSAVVLTLAPGNYTVQVAGVNGTSGTALVEVYELP